MRIFNIFTLLYVLSPLIICFPTHNDAFSDNNNNKHTFLGNETDRLALLDIKSKITLDPHGVVSSWNDSVDFCSWEGVTCGRRHKRVTKLNLTSKGLVGTLSPYVGNLSFLRDLEMDDNSFSGHIPNEVGRLFRLESLNLVNNSFDGEIPANISACSQLKFLNFYNNKLVGEIPSELGHLSKLQILSLSGNILSGSISPLSNLTLLKVLSLSIQPEQGGNGFRGTIPNFIGNFKDLTILALGGNSFTGEIPPSLYNLSKLQILSLAENHLEGRLPPNLGLYFPQLNWFQIRDNQFSGPIPISLSNLSKLELIEIGDNNFSGKFLLDGRNMKNLSNLNIIGANLGTGEAEDLNFINTLVNCSGLQILQISKNNFGGTLPHSIVNLSTTLRVVDLLSNQISGSIPSGFSKYQNLDIFYVDNNHFTGTIPADIGKITNLQMAYFESNHLSGSLPLSLGNLSWLSYLDLGDNQFNGTVPATLGNCKNLLSLYISHNNLVGNLPDQLFQASTLVKLYVDNNHLQGSLPFEIGASRNLVAVSMSNNNLSGTIPSSLGQCVGLTDLYLQGNSFVGAIPSSFNQLKSLQTIDLSSNKLSGQVPKYLANLSSLVWLNISFNNFEGEVPTSGVFANISAFLFVGNSKLCGGIPGLKLPICPEAGSHGKKKLHAFVIIAITISCILVALAIVLYVYLLQTRKKRKACSPSGVQLKEPFIRVSYDMLFKATNGFSARNLIGSGSFGSVYRGTLLLDGVENVVAIKVINNQRRGSSKSFIAECQALRIVRHRNLVAVRSACSSIDFQGNDFKALVYEFMPKGSLERWLYLNSKDDDQLRSLSLLQRLNIAIDVAHALDYIHNGNDPPIIHCDLKPSNILIDEDMTAHVGDFGLVKLLPEVSERLHDSSSIGVRGTIGYAAPEYGLGSLVSTAGDVYSYGIILLEIMTAKKPTDFMSERDMNLHKYAEAALRDNVLEIVDPKLKVDEDDEEERDDMNLNDTRGITICALNCISSMIRTGVKCSSELPQNRMDIKDVIGQLVSQRDNLFLCKRRHRCQLIT